MLAITTPRATHFLADNHRQSSRDSTKYSPSQLVDEFTIGKTTFRNLASRQLDQPRIVARGGNPAEVTRINYLSGVRIDGAAGGRDGVKVVFDRFIIPSFVTMEYFGYLRRDVDEVGYRNWVETLTADPSNYRHMIFGFIYSTEYRSRFGTP